MNRGSTPYALRGTSLVLPNGTLQNPAVRFGRERSGLFRSGDGRMSLGLKQFRAAEFSADGLAVFSNSPGNAHVTPLSVVRNNPTTADGQETAFDTYESGVLIARAAVFRESAAKSGFKWYGFNSGLHATPALALSGDKDLAVGRDLLVARNLLVSGTTRLVGNVTLDGTITGNATLTTLTTTGLATLNSLAVVANAIIGGSTPGGAKLTVGANGNGDGIHMFNNAAGTLVLSLTNATSTAGLATATSNFYVAFGARAGGFLGGLNDASVYTSGAAAGRLLLGAYGQARVVLDTGETRFFGDGLDLAGLVTTGARQGRWRLGEAAIVPYTQLHVQTRYAGDGITLGNSLSYPHAVTLTNNAQGVGSGSAHLYLFQCPGAGYMGSINDGGLYTSGSSAGRLILGAYDQQRIIIDSEQTRFFDRGGADRAAMITSGGYAGRWRLGQSDITPYSKLHIQTEWHGDGITIANSAGYSQAVMFYNNLHGPPGGQNGAMYLFFNQPNNGWIGGPYEGGLYTSGAAAGALLLGGQDAVRLKLDYTSVRFGHNATEYARIINGGYWGFRTTNPQRTLHVVAAGPGDGIMIAGGGGQDPLLTLMNNPDQTYANAYGYLGLVNANGQFIGGSLGSDVVVFSGGSAPGRLLLGSASQTRMIFDQGGNISVNSYNLGMRFGIKQSNNGGAGGLRLYHAGTDAVFFSHWVGDNDVLNIQSHLGYSVVVSPYGTFSPSHNQNGDLGGPYNNWRYCYFTAIGVQLGTAGPSYQIHLGGNSAAKPGDSVWQVVSDARSKDQKSIQAFGDGLAVVQRLRPIRYTYNGDFITPKGESFVGFAAEDLDEIAPEMVRRTTMKRRPEDDEAVEVLGVSLHPLFFLLVNAVQELASRVEQLEGNAA
jgi:hypothetical protein